MGKIIYNLKEILNELDLTPNHFAVEAKIRPNTIYKMVNNDTPRLPLETVAKVLDSLNEVAQERNLDHSYDIADLLTYK